MTTSVSQCLRQAIQLQTVSDSPRLDCEVLLGFVLNKNRTWLYTWPEYELSSEEFKHFSRLLDRRISGEPIAYILGEREFWSLNLSVNDSTLIPRPDTEILVETALNLVDAKNSIRFLDLGTGTGAIALAIAHERPHWQGVGVDQSTSAVDLAEGNRQKLGINNVQFLQSDWFKALGDQKFALIMSNPPYIDGNDEHLTRGDVRFEPRSALVAGNGGFADIEVITDNAPKYLVDGGWLMFEHGFQQADQVREILIKAGFVQVQTFQDLAGNDRVTIGCLQKSFS